MVRRTNGNSSKPSDEDLAVGNPEYWYWRQGSAPPAPAPLEAAETLESVFQIPNSLVVTAATYHKFMHKNRLYEVIEGLLEGVNVTRIGQLQTPAAQIKAIISKSKIPDPMYTCIYKECQRLGSGLTLVWPVTLPYAMVQCSKEYLERPYLEATNPSEVIGAIKTWWASLFDATAIYFREVNRQSHRDTGITLAVQQAPLHEAV